MNSIPISMIGEVMNVQKSNNSNLYVGLCGTKFVGSDRYAVVITEVISPKSVRVANVYYDDYNNNITPDKDGNDHIDRLLMTRYSKVSDDLMKIVPAGKVYKLRKNGRWIEEGYGLWSTGAVHFGKADNYRDPSF